MEAKIASLLRHAADEAHLPASNPFVFDILPRLLLLVGKARTAQERAGVLSASGPRGKRAASGAESSPAAKMRERAQGLALMKEAQALHEAVDIFAFDHAGGVQKTGGAGGARGAGGAVDASDAVDTLVPLLDEALRACEESIESALAEIERQGEQAVAQAHDTVTSHSTGSSRLSNASRENQSQNAQATEEPGTREGQERKSSFGSRFGAVGAASDTRKSKPSATEQLKKREDKKKKREEKKSLYDNLDSLRAGGTGTAGTGDGFVEGDAPSENAALVEDVLAQLVRLKQGTLPWAAKLIGVPVTADRERARRQYRVRAREFHPDLSRHPRAQEAFTLLQEAWRVFESQSPSSEPASREVTP